MVNIRSMGRKSNMGGGDMHYHCGYCGATSSRPAVCTTAKCEGKGEEMELCRKRQCSPHE